MGIRAELEKIVNKINANPETIKEEKKRVYEIRLKESEPIQLIMGEGEVAILEGVNQTSDVALIVSEKDFLLLLKNELNTTMAFMTGALKVEGSIGLALKLQIILSKYQS